MITWFLVGLVCGLAMGVAGVFTALLLLYPGYEGDALDKGGAEQ